MDSRLTKTLPIAYGFLGAAIFYGVAHAAPALAQAIGVVRLQATSPGIQQTGNTNVSGKMMAAQVNAVTSSSDAVFGQTNSASGIGIHGYASAASGSTCGGWFQSDSSSGKGLQGQETATSGITYGVLGYAASTSGRGVQGNAGAGTGDTYGGWFQSDSTNGKGVQGYASAGSGVTYGVLGSCNSTAGRAVQGNASAGTGNTYGGWFQSDSTDGKGVQGQATATTGATYGVFGYSASNSGRGVQGNSSATSGNTYGGFFQADSTDGKGVQGYTSAVTGITYGVFGSCNSVSGRAVQGNATAATGSAYGGWFQTDSVNGAGVLGWASRVGGLSGDFYGPFHVTGDSYVYDTGGVVVGIGDGSLLGNINGPTANTPGCISTYAAGSGGSNPIAGMGYIVNGGQATNLGEVNVLYNHSLGAMMYMQDTTTGVITASIKNFREPNPYQEKTDITYTCLEGPEAAMYVRGTCHLVGGRGLIVLPKHFTVLAALDGMTVQLTPLSPESLGVCVTRKGLDNGIEIAELHKGSGTYDVDYEVKAVRARFKDYKVIRPSMGQVPGGGIGDLIDESQVRQLDTEPRRRP